MCVGGGGRKKNSSMKLDETISFGINQMMKHHKMDENDCYQNTDVC